MLLPDSLLKHSLFSKHSLIMLLFLLIYTRSGAQEHENTLTINTWAGFINRQDMIFSSLVHKDISLITPSLGFTRQAKLYQNIFLGFAMFNPSSSELYEYSRNGETHLTSPHNFIFGKIRYTLGKTWKNGNNGFTAGLMLQANIQALIYNYGRISSFGYYSAAGPGIMAAYSLNTGDKGNLSFALAVPAVSLYARSPYLVNDDEFIENTSSHSGFKTFAGFINDGQWLTWNRLQHFDLKLQYDHEISSRLKIGSGWSLDYIHANEPRELLSFQNIVFISLGLRL